MLVCVVYVYAYNAFFVYIIWNTCTLIVQTQNSLMSACYNLSLEQFDNFMIFFGSGGMGAKDQTVGKEVKKTPKKEQRRTAGLCLFLYYLSFFLGT